MTAADVVNWAAYQRFGIVMAIAYTIGIALYVAGAKLLKTDDAKAGLLPIVEIYLGLCTLALSFGLLYLAIDWIGEVVR